MVPLADPAADAGHEVAFLTGAQAAGYPGGRTLLPAGRRPRRAKRKR